ncbi:MAG: ATP-grasp domain-containing protein, partial [Gaiellaceae bacterium]
MTAEGYSVRSNPIARPTKLAAPVDLYEYQGKELYARFGIPVSQGRLATTPEEARAAAEELGGQVVVKAQVLTGGRGKAG